ncbi:MAG: DUF2189 domain-containing protein [Rhodospirillales bacterium]|nr:DUF2189 domain-containing protein [Rhodospirillales bacterium]
MHIRNPIEWVVEQIEAPGKTIGSALPETYWSVPQQAGVPEVQRITMADLKTALRQGVEDFAACRTDVMFLCLIYPVIGFFIAGAEAKDGLLPLLFPTAAGFVLVGPFFAIGLYEMSRQREITGKVSWVDMFKVLRSPSIGPIALLGLLLIAIFLVWLTVAQGIYDITLGPAAPVSLWAFVREIFTTPAGWMMTGLGWAVGVVFMAGVLAVSVVSFPLMLDRPVALRTAMAVSLTAVRRNPVQLGGWGLLVAASLFIGALPCFVGLILVLPILGHSTWHLYRKVVRPPMTNPLSSS